MSEMAILRQVSSRLPWYKVVEQVIRSIQENAFPIFLEIQLELSRWANVLDETFTIENSEQLRPSDRWLNCRIQPPTIST